MSSALTWGQRTLVASGTVGSYSLPNSSLYTFRIYATATKSGRNASIYFEYTLTSGGQSYAQYSGPSFKLYVDGTSRVSGGLESLSTNATATLATYTKTLTADALGNFNTTSVKGEWLRNGSSGYPPKNCTIQDTSVKLQSIDPLGINVKANGSWTRGIVYTKVSGSWKQGTVYVKANGSWKVGQ